MEAMVMNVEVEEMRWDEEKVFANDFRSRLLGMSR
jgi:hypothetical protein